LLHMPAPTLWIEWCNQPWQSALERYGFPPVEDKCHWVGRRGALIKSTLDGRSGVIRTFWTAGGGDCETLASALEAYFDFDTQEGEEPEPLDGRWGRQGFQVRDETRAREEDVLARCFRFRYERSWADYYGRPALSEDARSALWRYTLGSIARDIPVLLAFVLLLSTRTGLPQCRSDHERLNRARLKGGKRPLLDHIEVRAPLMPDYLEQPSGDLRCTRSGPRLHHVRGHLMRRGSQLFWRVPHLRGSARAGIVRTRTVEWTIDQSRTARDSSSTERHAPYLNRREARG
jgi:hypothetical protein